MYTITINDNEPIDVEDFAVVNTDGVKTLYVRLLNGEELGFGINGADVEVINKERVM